MALLSRSSILEILEDQELTSTEVDQLLDGIFGLTFDEAPSSLEHSYSGLDSRALLTSYRDYWAMIEKLNPHPTAHFFEPGAGYFRAFFLYSILYPELKYTGIEQVEDRVQTATQAAKELDLDTKDIQLGDALKMRESFDLMYLYLPSSPQTQQLIRKAKQRLGTSIIAMESHGDLIPLLDGQRNSLKLTEIIHSESLRHREGIFVYQTSSFERDYADKLLEASQDVRKCFVIAENDEEFLIPTKDSWFSIQDGYITSEYPLMEIQIKSITDVIVPEKELIPWHHLRFSMEPENKVRKIFTKPEPVIEFVIKGRVPLRELQT
jgi:precorrin-6B methylase 2